MSIHLNLPYSLPLTIGKRYHDVSADETSEILIGSEFEPVFLGKKDLPSGQHLDLWLVMQNELPLLIVYRNGVPSGIEKGYSYRLEYRQIGYLVSPDCLDETNV
jgi:hypothetical protein